MRRLHQNAHLHGTHLPLEYAILFHPVARTGCPGKIVDVIAVIGDGLCVVRIIRFPDFYPTGSDDFELRHREFDIGGDAEVMAKNSVIAWY